MDDDARAELAALRRRAFGPDPDIAADPVAIARLRVLEERARSERMPEAPDGAQEPDGRLAREPGGARAPVGEPPGSQSAAQQQEARATAERPPRRARWALIAALAIGAAALGSWALGRIDETTADPDPMPTAFPAAARILDRVELFGPLGNGLRVEVSDTWPAIDQPGDVDWAAALGARYGWSLWVMGVDTPTGKEHCLVVERHGLLRHECDPVDEVAQGTLHLVLPVDAIPVALRPLGADALDVHWRADGVVTISTAQDPG